MIQRYAIAVGDENPLYFDDAYARACGYPGIIAPPNFLPAILGWSAGPPERDLLADGTESSLVPPEIAGLRLMGGGQALSFGQPVVPGDDITARCKLVDMHQRQGRSGELIIAVTETIYTNQCNNHLVTSRATIIAAK
jgi:acyl dehydratase